MLYIGKFRIGLAYRLQWHAIVVSYQAASYREEGAFDERADLGADSFEQHARLTQRLSQLTVPEAPYGLGLKVLRGFTLLLIVCI